jgi:hypothetical protein
MKPNRILIFLVAAIVLATAIVVVVVNNTTQTKHDANSPEGTVQTYLESIYASDNLKAASYLSKTGFCTVEDLDMMGVQTKPRILFADSIITGNKAQVKINVELDNVMPMGNMMNESHTMRLVRFGSGWQLMGIPWPLNDCGVVNK